MNKYPRIVCCLVNKFDAWIVGSAADPNKASKPRDYDVLVPFAMWNSAASLIPVDSKPNSFGGWKFRDGDVDVDVWPGDLCWILTSPKTKFAIHPRSGTLVSVDKLESDEV